MLVWLAPANAAQLKDVRLGEYNEFTRIVFDLDGPTASPEIEIRPSGQLLITFKKAGVSLLRKIPVERGPHIKDIQIWQRQGRRLSVLVITSHSKIRIESFRLSRPPRFAVDIFPVAQSVGTDTVKPSESSVSGAQEVTPPLPKNDAPNIVQPADAKSRSTARRQPTDQPASSSSPEDVATTPHKDDHSSAPGLAVKNRLPPKAEESIPATRTPSVGEKKAQPPSPKQLIPQSPKPGPLSAPDNAPSFRNRLQLYLIVTLVIITIVILLMLLLMLITSRHRLSGDKTK
jgi:hypothetical protein